jgi:hypothetical protein
VFYEPREGEYLNNYGTKKIFQKSFGLFELLSVKIKIFFLSN